MPNRFEHAADVADRLTAGGLTVTGLPGGDVTASVHKTRVVRFSDKVLPVCCVYGTGEDAQPMGNGWLLTHTIKIDLVVKAADGFDAVSGPLIERVKAILFSDPVWLGRWRTLPSFTVQQLGEKEAEQVIAYETLVMRCTDTAITNYTPPPSLAPVIEGVDTDIDIVTGDPPEPDGSDDLILVQDTPET